MFRPFRKKYWETPSGQVSNLYKNMSEQTHLLIAGETGSGKSVVINGILSTLMYKTPDEAQLILIDPKRVELIHWKSAPHTIYYASEPGEPKQAMLIAMNIIEKRFKAMQERGERKSSAGAVYVVIDELADLMVTAKRDILPLLQRVCQIGRAANVHVIAATQCPLAKVIPTEVKVNFDSILGLRTATRQHSRNILELPGCEDLPRYGFGYYRRPEGLSLEQIPMIPDAEIDRLVSHWNRQKAKIA